MNVTASNKLIDLSLLTRYDGKLKTYISGLIGTLGNKAENTPYANIKDYVDTQVATINGAAGTLEGRVAANEAALTKLNGASTVEGSVAKAVADAIAGVIDGAPEAFDTLKEIAAWIGSGEDIAGTTAAAMLSDITVLKGDANTTGSVAKALKDAKDYADGLASNYDAAGAAAAVQGSTTETVASVDAKVAAINNAETGILKNAKDYADGLAGNYDATGAAAAVQGSTTETVASVDAKVEALALASNDEIDALFA